MGAPKGNQFWKQRSKHGVDKLFSSPEILWEAACEYFQWCDEHPLMAYEWNGKDPIKCDLEKMRAYTQKGLCLFLDIDEQTLENYLSRKDFFGIVTRIKNTIFTQKFEGAAAGLLNPNIIARELGLTDKQETKVETSGELIIKGQKFADKAGQ